MPIEVPYRKVFSPCMSLAVDLLSQVVITLVAHTMQRHSPHYPVGRSRLEALGVIACACIMSIASLEVVQFSGWDLIQGLQGACHKAAARAASHCCHARLDGPD